MAALPTITNLVRTARRSAGMTQAELAERLETTQSAIARLESPQANPRLATLLRAVEAAGHALEINLRPAPSASVDESLIATNLQLDPSERLRRFAQSYRHIAGVARKAEVVGR